MSKSLVVFGATGNQGSAVLRALYEETSSGNNTIYAIHNRPVSASILLERYPSIKPIQGDFGNSSTIFRAIGSAPDAVFFITVSGRKHEVEEGKAIINAAVQAGTKHIVMGSVDRGPGGNVLSGVDIWDTKHEIEAFLRKQSNKVTYTIIRSAAFLENFVPGFIGQIYASVWRDCVGGNKMALVSTRDIGFTAAKTMLAAEAFSNVEIDLAGDNLSFAEASLIFEKETRGKKFPTANKYLVLFLVGVMKDLKQMAKFYKERGTGAQVQHDLMNWGAYIRQSEYTNSNKS